MAKGSIYPINVIDHAQDEEQPGHPTYVENVNNRYSTGDQPPETNIDNRGDEDNEPHDTDSQNQCCCWPYIPTSYVYILFIIFGLLTTVLVFVIKNIILEQYNKMNECIQDVLTGSSKPSFHNPMCNLTIYVCNANAFSYVRATDLRHVMQYKNTFSMNMVPKHTHYNDLLQDEVNDYFNSQMDNWYPDDVWESSCMCTTTNELMFCSSQSVNVSKTICHEPSMRGTQVQIGRCTTSEINCDATWKTRMKLNATVNNKMQIVTFTSTNTDELFVQEYEKFLYDLKCYA